MRYFLQEAIPLILLGGIVGLLYLAVSRLISLRSRQLSLAGSWVNLTTPQFRLLLAGLSPNQQQSLALMYLEQLSKTSIS